MIAGFNVNKECTARSYKKDFLLEACKTLKLDCDKKQLNVDLCNKIKKHLSSKKTSPSPVVPPSSTLITFEGKQYDFANHEKDNFVSAISLKTLKDIAAHLSIKKKTFKTKKEWAAAIYRSLVKQSSPPVRQEIEKLTDTNIRIGKKTYDFSKYEEDAFYTGLKKQTLEKIIHHFKINISSSKPKKKDYGKAVHDYLVGGKVIAKEPSVKAVQETIVTGLKIKKDGKVYDFTKRDKTTFYNPIKKQIFIAIARDARIPAASIKTAKKKKDLVELIYNKLTEKKTAPPVAPAIVVPPAVIPPPAAVSSSKTVVIPPPSTATDQMSVQEIREAIKKCLAL